MLEAKTLLRSPDSPYALNEKRVFFIFVLFLGGIVSITSAFKILI